jgi:hypothetical protein
VVRPEPVVTSQPRPRPRETTLIPPVERHLTADGYTVLVNPDGEDYFDLAAVRGEEVGLVELKIADWKTLKVQAAVRRTYADWVAVALPRRSLAERLLARMEGPLLHPVGVWLVEGEQLEILRAAEGWPPATRALFPEHRAALREMLAARAAGSLPVGATWSGFAARSAREAGGRHVREWRLDEFEGGTPVGEPGAPTDGSAARRPTRRPGPNAPE